MNSMSSRPSDAEAVGRLLAESGVEETQELTAALTRLRSEASTPAPAPNPELEAFFTAGVTPLHRPSRRRGFLLGGAVIAAMAAGTTGVAAANGGLWITAEDTHEAPPPASFEQVPAPAQVPEQIDPAQMPADLPAEPEETEQEPEADAEVPEPDPAEAGQLEDGSAEPGWGGVPGTGSGEHPGNGRWPEHEMQGDSPGHGAPGRDTPGRDESQEGPGKGQGGAGRPGGKDDHGHGKDNGQGQGRDNNQGRGEPGKPGSDGRDSNRGGPPHGRGPGG